VSAAREPQVAAIVVNWNGGDVTRRCVESVRRSRGVSATVVIVDNASNEAEGASLTATWGGVPGVELVMLAENRHFAGGVNAGAARALERGATHLLFMNNDTELEPDCIELLVAAWRERPQAGIYGPALLDLRDRRPLSLGERYAPWSLAVPRTLLKVRSTGDGRPYRVGGIMGSVIMVTRQCFERTGPYREDLLVYYEEVDFCLRARRRGFQPILVPRAVALHDGLRGFAAGLQPYAARLKCRNPLWLIRDHGSSLDRLAFVPAFAAVVASSALLYAARGRFDVVRAMGRGVVEGWKGAPAAGTGARP
jgi:GT2 family glycosyltransferase